MRLTSLVFFLAISIAGSAKAFEMNMRFTGASARLGVDVQVHELAVREKAHVHTQWFCTDEDMKLQLLGTAVVSEKSEYVTMTKVTILPGHEVDVVLIPEEDETMSDAVNDALQGWSKQCQQWSRLFPHYFEVPTFAVRSVNGVERLSDLITIDTGYLSPSEFDRGDLRKVQLALQAKGFYRGAIDGIWGKQSEAALLRYQESSGLPQSGNLDLRTLEKLDWEQQVYVPPKTEKPGETVSEAARRGEGETPPEDRLTSILRNTEKLKEQAAESTQLADASPGRSSEASAIQQNAMVRSIQQQIARCWRIDASTWDVENLNVEIRVVLNPDATVRDAQIVDFERMFNDSFFRSAAENARRAILRCSPYTLPANKYEVWRDLTLKFDPSSMFGG